MVGLIGAGNMARALARGWGEPVLVTDSGSGRAAELVAEVGGEALGTDNAELARRADAVLLCHKPHQLDAVATEIAPHVAGKLVVSVLGGTELAALTDAYPDAHVVAAMPNTPVEVRRGVVCLADGPHTAEARALFAPLGLVVVLPASRMEAATGIMGVAPAYVALVLEAHVDAGVRRGLPAPIATTLAVAAFAGTAALIEARSGDTLSVRREVTSPGGSTARGLAALERAGVRAAFDDAMGAVLER